MTPSVVALMARVGLPGVWAPGLLGRGAFLLHPLPFTFSPWTRAAPRFPAPPTPSPPPPVLRQGFSPVLVGEVPLVRGKVCFGVGWPEGPPSQGYLCRGLAKAPGGSKEGWSRLPGPPGHVQVAACSLSGRRRGIGSVVLASYRPLCLPLCAQHRVGVAAET